MGHGPPKTPLLTVDVLIELEGGLVLIERRNDPVGWALPGGFVDVGETVEAAAVREALEETQLQVELTAMLGVYSDPSRDPRGHTVSVAFVGRAQGLPVGADDARRAEIFSLSNLPSPLCFDHAQLIADYAHFKSTGERLLLHPRRRP